MLTKYLICAVQEDFPPKKLKIKGFMCVKPQMSSYVKLTIFFLGIFFLLFKKLKNTISEDLQEGHQISPRFSGTLPFTQPITNEL